MKNINKTKKIDFKEKIIFKSISSESFPRVESFINNKKRKEILVMILGSYLDISE